MSIERSNGSSPGNRVNGVCDRCDVCAIFSPWNKRHGLVHCELYFVEFLVKVGKFGGFFFWCLWRVGLYASNRFAVSLDTTGFRSCRRPKKYILRRAHGSGLFRVSRKCLRVERVRGEDGIGPVARELTTPPRISQAVNDRIGLCKLNEVVRAS
jgi:hypothetical protein